MTAVPQAERETGERSEREPVEVAATRSGVSTWSVGVAGALVVVAGLVAAALLFTRGGIGDTPPLVAPVGPSITVLAALGVATAILGGASLVVAAIVLGRYARAASLADELERRLDEGVARREVARVVLDRAFDARFAALEAGTADLPALRSAVADLEARAVDAGTALRGSAREIGEGQALRRIPLRALEGVTHAQEDRYRDAGVRTTWELAASDAADLARRAEIPESTVRRHQAMGDLLTLDDVEPADAATLVEVGVGSVAALAEADPDRLADAIAQSPAPPGAPAVYRRDVEAWIAGARRERARLSRRTEVPAEVERP